MKLCMCCGMMGADGGKGMCDGCPDAGRGDLPGLSAAAPEC